jgi:two-component system phosphate regulon response regulator PhoB
MPDDLPETTLIPHLSQSGSGNAAPAPLVLVAEDDDRVRELLHITFHSERFRVVTAADGDEAIRVALAERPDLVVLDVQLPRRNGFEVCDWLRHDPEDPQVPIVLVSASGDTDVRVEGLGRGADDFLSKPFSPKELVARARRLLARSADARTHRKRSVSLERELGRAQEETRRAHHDLAQERRLRETAATTGADFATTLDPDELGERVLAAVRRIVGAPALALLVPDRDATGRAVLAPRAFLGTDAANRFGALELHVPGEACEVLLALGRPVLRHELERPRGSWRDELAGFLLAGVALVAPLRGSDGIEGLVVADERPDGVPPTPGDRAAIGVIGDLAAAAMRNARRFREAQDRALSLAAERSDTRPVARRAAAEAARIVDDVSGLLGLPERERGLLRHLAAFGPWVWSAEGRQQLEEMERDDPTRRVRELRLLAVASESLESLVGVLPSMWTAAQVAAVCVRYQVGRIGGRSPEESGRTAMSWCASALDPETTAAFAAVLVRPGARGHAA